MKKKSLLLIFSLITIIGFCQQVIWLPGKGSVYGDVMQIKIDDGLLHIENRIIGYNDGDLVPNPVYLFNGFQAPATYFQYQDLNALYVSQLGYPPILSQKDTNRVIIRYETTWGEQVYDTADYYYSRPVLECLNVNGIAYSENMLLVNPSQVTINLEVKASLYNVPESFVIGDDRIDGIFEVINGNEQFYNLGEVRYEELPFGVDLSSLSYGLNELEYYAYGRKADNDYPDEFSGKIKIRILIFDFKLRYDDDYAVCKCDTAYHLQGLPEGGVFSGECIVESSNVFDPNLTSSASTLITYEYPVDGIYYPVERTITFDPLPVIAMDVTNLTGFPHEVCGFEHGTVYEITGTGFSDLFRSLPFDILKKYQFDGNKVTIDWLEDGDSSIYVTALSDKDCYSKLEHMIHINFTKSPEDSAYVTLYDRMLFCNANTTMVKVFDWYGIIGGNTVFYDRTEKPYYVLDFLPVAGDSFFALTAVDTTSCNTHSHIYTKPAGPKSDQVAGDGKTPLVRLYPNPSRGNANCEILQPMAEGIILITDLLGRQVRRISHSALLPGDVIRLETGDLKSGIYYIVFSGDGLSRSYKFVVY